MRSTIWKPALIIVVLLVFVGASIYAQGQQGQGQAGAPPGRQGGGGGQGAPLQNIQVLPKDWTRMQVMTFMRTFTAALGVECSHCHTGTNQERAKDDNPKKGIARKMITMTNAINNEHLKGVGEPVAAGAAAKVTCFTCHRGAIKPLNAPPPGGGGH